MPDKKYKKLQTIEREDSLDFEIFKDYDPNAKSGFSGTNPNWNKCYSYHFRIGWQKVSGWSGVCDIDKVPVLESDHGGSYDLRHEIYVDILSEFKAELYSKMYNVPIAEAIYMVETGMVDDKPAVYEELDGNFQRTGVRSTKRCKNIDEPFNK